MKTFSLTSWHLRSAWRVVFRIFSSPRFFWAIAGLLFFQAGWIAISARYPGAFDEQYHFGIIQIFTHHLSPLLTSQPASADQFGALPHGSSLMYHYVMSLPLRLLQALHVSQTDQIISLRLLNVILLCSTLIPLRKLFLLVGVSRTVTHALLLFFVCIPVVPLLGSQINYDNVLIPLTALSMLLLVQIVKAFQAKTVAVSKIVQLLLICVFASLVKYAFLPIFLAIVVVVGIRSFRLHKGIRPAVADWLRTTPRLLLGAYVGLMILLLGQFVATYGYNSVRYHTPIPDCSAVLTVNRCQAYSPWERNYRFANTFSHPHFGQILTYGWDWLTQSIRELVFTISSSFMSDGMTVAYYAKEPLPILWAAAWVVFVIGLLLVILHLKQIWRDALLRTLLTVSLFYIAVLFLQNFRDFYKTGMPVAIHGRYLLPILPFLFVLAARSFEWSLVLHKRFLKRHRFAIQAAVTVVCLLLLTQGGGLLAYMVRSDDDWHTFGSPAVQHINRTTHDVLKHTIIGA